MCYNFKSLEKYYIQVISVKEKCYAFFYSFVSLHAKNQRFFAIVKLDSFTNIENLRFSIASQPQKIENFLHACKIKDFAAVKIYDFYMPPTQCI